MAPTTSAFCRCHLKPPIALLAECSGSARPGPARSLLAWNWRSREVGLGQGVISNLSTWHGLKSVNPTVITSGSISPSRGRAVAGTGCPDAQPDWQPSATALAPSTIGRNRRAHGDVVLDWHAQLACCAVRALRAGFAEAKDATPQLDHRFQHRGAAASLTFDCHVLPPVVVQRLLTLNKFLNISRTFGSWR